MTTAYFLEEIHDAIIISGHLMIIILVCVVGYSVLYIVFGKDKP